MTSPAENRNAHTALVEQLRGKLATAASGWFRTLARPPCRPRQAAAARPCRRLLDAGSRCSKSRRWRPTECMTTRRPGAGHHHRDRPGVRPRVHDRGQRRDGQGRHLLPDDGQEAPARSGDRAAEPAALHLSGRLRWRVPADAGRGFPGPRPFRPDLLQPGQMSARRAFRRSPRCSDPAPPAAHTFRR